MNKIVLVSIILLCLLSCNRSIPKTSKQKVLNTLDHLVEAEDYFKLKQVYQLNRSQLSEIHSLYYQAIIYKVFNQAEASNSTIMELLENTEGALTDSMVNKIYHTKLLNHVNLYEYAEAAKCSEFIQKDLEALNDSTDMENLKNELKIWTALKNVPKQVMIKTADAVIPMTKDKVGLLNIDVSFGDSTKNLLFDTGANFSVMVRSLARKLGLSIIDADFYVTAATGLKVKSDITIVPELSIGGIIFKNVFFLVLNDKDLSFPQIDYYINGAIGFPVIEAMEEIRITKKDEIIVPYQPSSYSYENFALNGLMPIVAVSYKEDTLRFHFDTGATTTSLYRQFYKDYKIEVESNSKREAFSASSGGGMVQFEGYIIQNLQLKVGDSAATIDSVRLHIEDIGSTESNFHGNLGQDYIKQFDEMIISFISSSISFR